MLFRPSFCANCGEKVERERWGLLTSRRFCQVCESQYKGHDLLPRIIVAVGVLTGIFGFGSYLNTGNAGNLRVQRTPAKVVEMYPPVSQTPVSNVSASGTNASTFANSAASTKPAPIAAVPQPKPETQEATFYCGAETKKGTPCSRRVRTANARCYQHAGMPVMGSASKAVKQGN